MTKTTNYQLNQWAKSDRVLMDDFNADNQKIDAALSTMPRIVTGSYTGDGAETREINLGFRPRAALITDANGIFNTSAGINGGLVLDGLPTGGAAISENGFTVQNPGGYSSWKLNLSGTVYYYLAFC